MKQKLRIGYIPLVDAALLHVARDMGFAAAQGLDIELVRETSWSNIRDKLNVGIFDAAHMLAPAAIACSLGLGHFKIPLVAPVTLGLDGNAITLSPALFEAIMAASVGDPADPRTTANALASVVAQRRAAGLPPPAFGHVFPFSCHHYQLRLWLAAGGIDPDQDLRLVVVPPPFMVQSLTRGQIDGFCVGAPWNALAGRSGVGRILHRGRDIVRNCPEKVLALRADFATTDRDSVAALSKAIRAAADWAADGAHCAELAEILFRGAGLGVSTEMLRGILAPALQGSAIAGASLRFDRAATFAYPSHAAWIYGRMVEAGQMVATPDAEAAARAVYQPELAGDMAAANRLAPELVVLGTRAAPYEAAGRTA